jgi:hypothetical protein
MGAFPTRGLGLESPLRPSERPGYSTHKGNFTRKPRDFKTVRIHELPLDKVGKWIR